MYPKVFKAGCPKRMVSFRTLSFACVSTMILAVPLHSAVSQDTTRSRSRCSAAPSTVDWAKLDASALSVYNSWLRRNSGEPEQWVHPALSDGASGVSFTIIYTGSPSTLTVCGCTLESVERDGVANLFVPLRSLAALSRLPSVQTILYGDEMDPLGG